MLLSEAICKLALISRASFYAYKMIYPMANELKES